MAKPKFYAKNKLCHLCELPIPYWIVDPKHLLVGTIDHVVPRSKGGTDGAYNRAPAHMGCNYLRGSKDITPELKEACKHRALTILSTMDLNPSMTDKGTAVVYLQVRKGIKLLQKTQSASA